MHEWTEQAQQEAQEKIFRMAANDAIPNPPANTVTKLTQYQSDRENTTIATRNNSEP